MTEPKKPDEIAEAGAAELTDEALDDVVGGTKMAGDAPPPKKTVAAADGSVRPVVREILTKS